MDIKEKLTSMTLEEKAGLCSGADYWHTKSVERINIPSIMVSDGPHGLRKQVSDTDHLGLKKSIKSVCFPTACAVACSFNRELLYDLGETLGKECQAEDISIILGPAVNIKRSPLCGRNFEYFSEDPYLAGELAASYINGVQSQDVGTSIKHFAANNQETLRFTCSSNLDERTLREIYLTGFEIAIKKAKPWTVMSSYNQINGEYATESKTLLTDILRTEWGFDGFVMSDWGAVNDRIRGLLAGLDLEMPSSGGVNDRLIMESVKDGTLPMEVLDQTVERILSIIDRHSSTKQSTSYDISDDHEKALQFAEESIVLLKNDDDILPIKTKKVAFIGEYAKTPRYQGGGSSHINSYKIENALMASKEFAEVRYVRGYCSGSENTNELLVREAIDVAKRSDVAVIFAGLPDVYESESYDRSHMNLPQNQIHLINEISRVQPNTVVVLHNGSPVTMPWIDHVKGILEVYLCGETVGQATANILFGKVNPSGKLAESFPIKLSDTPSYLNFGHNCNQVQYCEGLFVGYRYYDMKEMNVLFPFGFGLSYTTFEYSNLTIDRKDTIDTDIITVTVDIKNTGNIAGKEVVQLYVADKTNFICRPIKELKGFAKVSLAPGETKTVMMTLDKRSFAIYHTELKDWYAPTGQYDILIGASSQDIRLQDEVFITSTTKLPFKVTLNTTCGEILAQESLQAFATEHIVKPLKKQLLTKTSMSAPGQATQVRLQHAINDNPLRALRSFCDWDIEYINRLIDQMNEIMELS